MAFLTALYKKFGFDKNGRGGWVRKDGRQASDLRRVGYVGWVVGRSGRGEKRDALFLLFCNYIIHVR